MRIPSGCSKLQRPEIIERVKGLIFGAVLGDSLGIATQGMTRDEVKKHYGEGPIQFGLSNDEVNDGQKPFIRDTYRKLFDDNDYSGDVDQLLLVVQILIENEGQFNLKSFTKKLETHLEKDMRQHYIMWEKKRDGYNGALVRSSVLGIPKFWDGTTVIENAAESCRAGVNRPDPRCMITCVILSTLVARYAFLFFFYYYRKLLIYG
ncbi:ADP-ribosylation/Crystallin J1 [Circinella umbellata]|nr:ADP-ribosylation/Crystallin J1 [Circinella umbellata]